MEPSTSDGRMEPSTLDGRMEPSTSDGRMEPSTSDGRMEPSTSDGRMEPSTSDDRMEPSTSDGRMEASTSDGRMETSTSDGRMEASTSDGRMEASTSDGRMEASTSDGRTRATPQRRSGKQTVSKGEIYFEPGEHYIATVLRIRVSANHKKQGWEPVCKRVWAFLREQCKLKLPGLLISVVRDFDKCRRQPDLEEIVQEGLMNTAGSTGAWIITDGTSARARELVGEAFENYRYRLKYKNIDAPVLIGIASADYVAQRRVLRKATRETHPLHYMIDTINDHPNLDQNHTYFLLVKDFETGGPGEAAMEFRSVFENFISTKAETKDGESMSTAIPKVSLVVGGGMKSFDSVKSSLKNHCPVIVNAASEGAAKLISATTEWVQKKNEEENGDNVSLPTSFDPKKDDLSKEIEHAALSAVLGRAGKRGADKGRIINHVLSLAIKWHRWDYAEDHLLIDANQGEWEEKMFLLDALLEDQSNILEYFLQHDLDLQNILTTDDLEKLYESEKNSQSMHDLLRYSGHFWKKYKKKTFSLGYINKVLVHLMRDDSFALYSVYKKEKRTVTDTTDVQQSTNQKDVRRTKFWERDLFLWAILTNRRKMSLLFWRRGLDHLGGALCASAMLKRLAAIAERTESADISEDLRDHSQHWERLAIQVLTECFSLNRDLTHKLLVRKLPRWGAGDSDATTLSESYPGCGIYAPCNIKNPQENPSVLRIAERYKLKKFVGHAACQTKLTAIWKGFMSSDTHELLILVCMFLPIFLPVIHFRNVRKRSTVASRDFTDNGGSARDDPRVKLCMGRCLCDVVHFYQAPITKFFANIAANLVYLAIFSYFLIVELDEGPPTLLEYITWAWLLTMIMEEVRQIFRDQRALKYRLLGWISFDWNQFDVTLYTVFVITVVLRFALPLYGANFRWARWFYSVTLVLCFIRFTQYFYGVKSIGPKVIMIQKMVKDMFLFLAVLVVFVIGFGVAYHANMFPNSPPEWSVLVNILYYPYFQIFGELFLDTLKGEGEGACTNNETVWRQDILKRCPENTGYIVHLMLAAYLIVTNILLVNLLIAMFSYTFQRVQQKSMEVWCYYRLSLVHEYFSRPVSVPPFIVFHYIFSIIRYFCCDRNAGLCKQYNAFRRAYSDEELRHLTLFERTAVKKVFIQTKEKPTRIEEIVGSSPQSKTGWKMVHD